jgi:hypothetical protein
VRDTRSFRHFEDWARFQDDRSTAWLAPRPTVRHRNRVALRETAQHEVCAKPKEFRDATQNTRFVVAAHPLRRSIQPSRIRGGYACQPNAVSRRFAASVRGAGGLFHRRRAGRDVVSRQRDCPLLRCLCHLSARRANRMAPASGGTAHDRDLRRSTHRHARRQSHRIRRGRDGLVSGQPRSLARSDTRGSDDPFGDHRQPGWRECDLEGEG